MHRITIFCFLAIASGAFVSKFQNLPNYPLNKIFGGRNTSIEEVPYQVSLDQNGEHLCGGSIITKKHIISACHCFQGHNGDMITNPENFTVRIGSTIWHTGGKVIKPSKITPHPNYNVPGSIDFDYDVLILELEEEIETSESAQIIALAKTEPAAGTKVTVSGWGKTEEGAGGGSQSEILQSVTIDTVTHEKCQRWFNLTENVVTERMICAGGEEAGSCKGDSGGPGAAYTTDGKPVLVGIVSWGRYCGEYGYPNVFVNVANQEIRSFILEQAGV